MYDRLSVVTTPATNFQLTTLATVKGDFKLTTSDADRDAYIGRLIDRKSAQVCSWCDRQFVQQGYTDTFRRRRPVAGYPTPFIGWGLHSAAPIELAAEPATAIASITLDGVVLTEGTDFVREQATGLLFRLNTLGAETDWVFEQAIAVYTAGYLPPLDSPPGGYVRSLPQDVEDATLELVKADYFARTRDPLLRSEGDPNVATQQWWVGSTRGGESGLNEDIAGLLSKYRDPVVV